MKKYLLGLLIVIVISTFFTLDVNALSGFDYVLDVEPFNICESSGALKAIYIVKILFNVVCYIVPIILIFTMSFDVYKLVSNPGDTKKVFPLVKKRLIAALVIVFTPTIIKLTMTTLGNRSNYDGFLACWGNSNPAYIEQLEQEEKAKKESSNKKPSTSLPEGIDAVTY